METPRRRTTTLISAALLALIVLAACGPTPTPPVTPGTPNPSFTATPGPSPTPGPPTLTPTASPSPTPTPIELVVCQTGEPLSLYLYGDDTRARSAIFQALFDGPIDTVGYVDQPVILSALPSVEAGTAGTLEVEVSPGQPVVDAVTGAVVPLVDGINVRQPDGSILAYVGPDPVRTIQVWAEFTLLPGLRWSDGEPLTADDSVFSYEIDASPDTPRGKYLISRTASYLATSDTTTRWTGLPGFLDSNYAKRFWTPLPRHAYGSLSAAALQTDPGANERPLGWGPFVISAEGWVKGGHLMLERNPYYFRAAEGLPRVDKVTFRFGLNAASVLDELATNTCHLSGDDVDWASQLPDLLAARDAGQVAAQIVPGDVFEHLDFGIQPVEGYRRGAGLDLFTDVRLRQAVAYCLDRQALIDQLVNGLSEVPAVYVPANHPLFGGDALTRYPFDPAQGQALLAAAGWADADGDGVREQGNRRLSLALVSAPPESAFRTALLEFMRTQLLTNCGIEALPELHTPEELYDVWPDSLVFGRQFDLAVFPWMTGSTPPCDLYLTSALPSDDNPGGSNDTGYSNPDYDAACQAALSALDAATRRAGQLEAQRLFTQDLPALPLFFRPKVGPAANTVRGYQLEASAASGLWNIEVLALAPES